jgi:hypothetical protein
MTTIEFRPWTSPAQVADAQAVVWRAPSAEPGAIRTDIDPWLTSFGTVPDRAIDLARLAAAAFAADQIKGRLQGFSRSFDLRVHLIDPAAWSDELLADLADLLSSLTADDWHLEVLRDMSEAHPTADAEKEWDQPRRVALLSGGLDSFAGAVLSSANEATLYLGHWDQSAVKKAQNAVKAWFASAGRPIEYEQVRFAINAQQGKVERTTRSRSLLFMALGVALAAGRGAHLVEVPENGHTSLNPPLGPERGGALSTRSTHPRTFARLNGLLANLEIDVVVRNPHHDKTKGELVALANAASPGDFARAAAETLSCAKLNGNYYKGGNPNYHCGLCVACIVRRGSLIAAGVADDTPYLCETLVGDARAKLLRDRASDVDAAKRAMLIGIEDEDLLVTGPYPDDLDLDAGLEVCRRGLAEMALVPLG